jgi:hypothetical protein
VRLWPCGWRWPSAALSSCRFEQFRQLCVCREVAQAVEAFAKPSSNGRAKASIVLQRAFQDVATLEALGDQGRLPYAVGSVTKPRPETRSVAINYAVVARFEDGSASVVSAPWSAEIEEGGLTRALQCGADLDAALLSLHRDLLDASAAYVRSICSTPSVG